MNDEFLHRLRQPPPAAFAARLRARLESQAMVRRFRTQQITLYALLACLLGGTALALVSPSVRDMAGPMVRQLLPDAIVNLLGSRAPERYAGQRESSPEVGSMSQLAAGSESATTVASSTANASAAVTTGVAVDARASTVPAVASARAATRTALVVEPEVDVQIEGAAAGLVFQRAILEAKRQMPRVRIEVRSSDNQQGFQKLCLGTIDIAVASRPILAAEIEACRRRRIDFIELPIAYEALAVFVNPANNWTDTLTQAQLKLLFDAASQGAITFWSEIDRSWPNAVIDLAQPRLGMGYAESFAEIILGPGRRPRNDLGAPRDEGGLTAHLRSNINGLTYLPFVYFSRDATSVGLVPRPLQIVNSKGVAVLPSRQSIVDRSYEPLSRPLWVYVNSRRDKASLDFLSGFLDHSERMQLVARSRYLALTSEEYRLAAKVLRSGFTGTAFDADPAALLTVREVLLRHVPENQREFERRRLESSNGR